VQPIKRSQFSSANQFPSAFGRAPVLSSVLFLWLDLIWHLFSFSLIQKLQVLGCNGFLPCFCLVAGLVISSQVSVNSEDNCGQYFENIVLQAKSLQRSVCALQIFSVLQGLDDSCSCGFGSDFLLLHL
jgi:hypothetical protein